MFCSKCGSKLADNSKFCMSCGEPIKIGQSETALKENEISPPNKQDNFKNLKSSQNEHNDLDFLNRNKIITVKPIKKTKGVIEIKFFNSGYPSLYGKVIPDEKKGTAEYCLYDDESQANLIIKIKPKDLVWVENEVFDNKENILGKITERCSGQGFNPVYKLEIITNDNKTILVKEKGGIFHFTFKWIGQLLFGNGLDILTIFFFFLTPRKGSIDFFIDNNKKIVSIERKGPSFNASWDYYVSRDLEKIKNILDPRLVLAVQSLMSFGKGK